MKTVRSYPISFTLILIGIGLSGQNYEKLEKFKGVKDINSGSLRRPILWIGSKN
jgi:hypothetical protein